MTREANAAPWRELTRVFRRLEARGEIREGLHDDARCGLALDMAAGAGLLREELGAPGRSRGRLLRDLLHLRRDSEEGQVVGTFKFHLLDPVSFATTLEHKLQESASRSTTPPAKPLMLSMLIRSRRVRPKAMTRSESR